MAEKTQRINSAKTTAVAKIKEIIKNSRDMVFTNYRGMTVAQITELRAKLRAESSQINVVKNNYTRIALREIGLPDPGDNLTGPTAITVISGDLGNVTKLLIDFSKEMPIVIKGGIIDGRLVNKNDIEAISKLPSRNELIARLMGSMKAPAGKLAYVLNAAVAKVVRTLKAYADTLQ